MFALVDANSFYCSAEQVFRPDWRGRPLVVLSNNDGIIVAANRQAKEVGVEKFKAYFQVKNQCEQAGVIVRSSNYELYGDLSEKMMQVVGRFAPSQHIYSIDESFLRFHGCQGLLDFKEHGRKLRRAVWKECRLPVCVGMGHTLTLAKAANHAAKKNPSYQGVCVIECESSREKILRRLLVSDIWGIGRKLSLKLRLQGIENAWQLSKQSPVLMRKNYSVEMERTIRELKGEPCKDWDTARADKQQIFSTRSVGERITNVDFLHQALCQHTAIAASKLRAQGSVCSVLMAFAGNSPYDEKSKSFKQMYRFSQPTNDTLTLTKAVSSLLSNLYQEGVRYYKVGIGLFEIRNGRFLQPDFFIIQKEHPFLMKVFDGINQRYGKGTLFLAAEGIPQKGRAQEWSMKRALLSPQYTTKWSNIPIIKT